MDLAITQAPSTHCGLAQPPTPVSMPHSGNTDPQTNQTSPTPRSGRGKGEERAACRSHGRPRQAPKQQALSPHVAQFSHRGCREEGRGQALNPTSCPGPLLVITGLAQKMDPCSQPTRPVPAGPQPSPVQGQAQGKSGPPAALAGQDAAATIRHPISGPSHGTMARFSH